MKNKYEDLVVIPKSVLDAYFNRNPNDMDARDILLEDLKQAKPPTSYCGRCF